MRTYVQMHADLHLGSQPDAADLELLRLRGVRTVIDLRLRSEIDEANQQLAARSGLRYVHIGVDKSSLTEDVITQVTRALRSGDGPYVVHSGAGVRAAVILVIRRAREKAWSLDKTLRTLRLMGSDISRSPEFLSFVRRSLAA